MITMKDARFKRILALTVLSTTLLLPSFSPIFAQSISPTAAPKKAAPLVPPEPPQLPINLTVSPVSINLVANPGETVTSQIKVRNNNTAKEYLKLSVLKFTSSTSGAPVIADLTPSDEFGSWLSYDEPEFTLDANEERTLRFRIAIPKDAALGYYYAIKIQRIENSAPGSRQTTVEGSPAIPVLLEVRSPHAKRELEIKDFTTDSPFYEYLPVQFKVTLKNSGNIHSIPVGDIFLDSSLLGMGDGKKNIASLSFNEGRGNILPQSERVYFTNWDDALMVKVPKATSGKGSDEYTLKWDLEKGNKLRIGKYTAHLLMVYDNGQRDIPLEATVSFWVLPWKLLLMIIGIIVGPALIVYLFMKWRYGKK